MYGLVHQAIKALVLSTSGAPAWERTIELAGVNIEPFVALRPYPDDVTTRLVASAAEVLGRTGDELLRLFGEFWISYSAEHGYGDLLELLGHDLTSFLVSLDGMHDRLRLSYPELNPPSIWCTDVTAQSLVVHYASDRPGLTPFVMGLLHGTAQRFGEVVEVRPGRGLADGHDHEELLVLRSVAA
jgi:hypothetical protein